MLRVPCRNRHERLAHCQLLHVSLSHWSDSDEMKERTLTLTNERAAHPVIGNAQANHDDYGKTHTTRKNLITKNF